MIGIAKAVQIETLQAQETAALADRFEFIEIDVEHHDAMLEGMALGAQPAVADDALVQAGIQAHACCASSRLRSSAELKASS